MSRSDKIFKDTCRDILENGMSTEGENVRPKWEDGTPAYTIKKFGVVNRYDLRKEFPALTLRKTGIKSATDELLWIWQKKSNNIKDLGSHVWDEWADSEGFIGKAYGYQMSKMYYWNDICEEGLYKAFPGCRMTTSEDIPGVRVISADGRVIALEYLDGNYGTGKGFWMDQVDKVIYDLINTPFSRRIMTNIYNFDDLSEMALYPCAYSMTFNVTEKDGKKVLNGILNQRSQDILAANNWNVCQYSMLVMMLAQVTGMETGEFVHVIADAHIYDRHVPVINELIKRDEYPAPKVSLNPEIKDFYKFTKDDVIIKDYIAGEQVKNIPVAI